MTPKRLTKRAYARHRGCDEKAVRRAEIEGRITLESDGSIDPIKADAQWTQNTRARMQMDRRDLPANGADTAADKSAAAVLEHDYATHRARREAAAAERAELETAFAAGRLISRERAEAGVFEAFRSIRDRVLAVPRRVAPTLVNLDSVRQIELTIDDELRSALGATADAIAAKLTPTSPHAFSSTPGQRP